jgi:phthalate 4,5-cis-dihydrodiol dehydrogenase
VSWSPLRLAVAGLGLAGSMVLDGVRDDPRVTITAGADPSERSRHEFAKRTGAVAYRSVEELCVAPDVDAVWIATPTRFHRLHVETAAAARKHVIVEKPMAASVADCDVMIAAAAGADVRLVAGGVRSLDPTFTAMRAVIESGAIGQLRHVSASAHTGWMLRPRSAAEMDEALGGGIVFNQAPHQIDTVRLLVGGRAALSVRAETAAWSDTRAGTGSFRADILFEDGITARLDYDGYGYLRSIGMIGSAPPQVVADAGMVIASGSRGAVRPAEKYLHVVGDDGEREVPIPTGDATTGAVSELAAALRPGAPAPLHSGEWGRATLALVVAILESARSGSRIPVG